MADTPTVVVTTIARADSGVDAPNVVLKTMQPFEVIFVRAARTFLQVLVGLLTAGVTGMGSGVLPAHDFVMLLKVSASLAIAPTVISLLQNTLELLTKLDQSAPSLRA